MAENSFKPKNISLQAQKNIIGKIQNAAKMLLDDNTTRLLDNLYDLTTLHLGSKKDSEKLLKNIIKIATKFAILQKNDVFSEEETIKLSILYQKFSKLQLTVISFFENEHFFDLNFVKNLINEINYLTKESLQKHLSEKSMKSIDNIFETIGNIAFLEAAFRTEPSPMRKIMAKIVMDLNEIIEQK